MAANNRSEVIVRTVGIVMMLCVCLLGVYAKHSIDLQEERVHKMQQEIDQLRKRFDDFLNTDRQIHISLTEKMATTKTCLDILMKKVDKMEDDIGRK